MHLERLSKCESDIIGEVLRAAADGPFFPDREFQTLFGVSREQVRAVADQWPLPSLPPDQVVLAVNNSLNWLLSYPHRKQNLWSDWMSADQKTVNDLFNRLRGKRDETPFERLM